MRPLLEKHILRLLEVLHWHLINEERPQNPLVKDDSQDAEGLEILAEMKARAEFLKYL